MKNQFPIRARRQLGVAAIAVSLLLVSFAYAEPTPNPDEVLAENHWAKITRGEYEAELLRLPPDVRGGFAVSAKRVTDLLVRMLITKSLAVQARASDLYKDVAMQRRRALEIDRADAGLFMANVEAEAAKIADARRAQFESRARELYAANRDSYRVAEQVAASHILFDTKNHSKEEALKLAQDARAKIVAGADFNELARQVSDDPTAKQNGGRIDYFEKQRMDPAFSDAAFGLKNVGDISAPVLSSFGYHVIRLDGRNPARVKSFDEVKDQLIAEERGRFIDQRREEVVAGIRNDPLSRINQGAVDALVIKIDPEAVKKATEAATQK
jgi:parvulin-like peptidyl-prolyl isomerase